MRRVGGREVGRAEVDVVRAGADRDAATAMQQASRPGAEGAAVGVHAAGVADHLAEPASVGAPQGHDPAARCGVDVVSVVGDGETRYPAERGAQACAAVAAVLPHAANLSERTRLLVSPEDHNPAV